MGPTANFIGLANFRKGETVYPNDRWLWGLKGEIVQEIGFKNPKYEVRFRNELKLNGKTYYLIKNMERSKTGEGVPVDFQEDFTLILKPFQFAMDPYPEEPRSPVDDFPGDWAERKTTK